MRFATLMTIWFAVSACKESVHDRFWRDRPDETRSGTVGGERFTIRVPEGLAHRTVEGREEFFVEGSAFRVAIGWATPADATRRLRELHGAFDKLERVGLDGAPPADIELDDVEPGREMTIELAGAKVGFVIDAQGPAQRDIYAFLPSGRPDGGFSCETDVPVMTPEEETRTMVARARGICRSLRTARSSP